MHEGVYVHLLDMHTVKTVLKREGINSDTSATMEEFMGTEEKA